MSEGENLKLRLWRGVIIDDYQVLGITLLLSDRERVGTKKKKRFKELRAQSIGCLCGFWNHQELWEKSLEGVTVSQELKFSRNKREFSIYRMFKRWEMSY